MQVDSFDFNKEKLVTLANSSFYKQEELLAQTLFQHPAVARILSTISETKKVETVDNFLKKRKPFVEEGRTFAIALPSQPSGKEISPKVIQYVFGGDTTFETFQIELVYDINYSTLSSEDYKDIKKQLSGKISGVVGSEIGVGVVQLKQGSLIAIIELAFNFIVTLMERFMRPNLAELVATTIAGTVVGMGVGGAIVGIASLATAPVTLPVVAAAVGGGAVIGATYGTALWYLANR